MVLTDEPALERPGNEPVSHEGMLMTSVQDLVKTLKAEARPDRVKGMAS